MWKPLSFRSLICFINGFGIFFVSKVVVFPTCFIFVPLGTNTPSTSKTISFIFFNSFFVSSEIGFITVRSVWNI